MPWPPVGAQELCPVLPLLAASTTLWLLPCPMTLALTKGVTHCVGLQTISSHIWPSEFSHLLWVQPLYSPHSLSTLEAFSQTNFSPNTPKAVLPALLQDDWIYCCCLHAYGMSLHLCTHVIASRDFWLLPTIHPPPSIYQVLVRQYGYN